MNAVLLETIVPPGVNHFPPVEPMPTDHPNDHELMLSVRDGDIAQLGLLFEKHHGPLYGFFVHLTNQRTQSEDLVQLVFYRILKYRHTYRDEGSFTAWMYHLARKVAADHYRKNRHVATHVQVDHEIERVADEAPNSSQVSATNDDLNVMRCAFAELEVEEREILTLQRFQHLAHDEIARLLECSVGAAKVRAHRALKSLREKYLRLSTRAGNSTSSFSL